MPENKRFTRAEVSGRNSKQDAVFIIHNVVYDVTQFLDEHPGGHEVLVGAAGTDASEDFDDIGHSLDAKELMKKFMIGELVDEDKVEQKKKAYNWDELKKAEAAAGAGPLGAWRMPLLAALVLSVLYALWLA